MGDTVLPFDPARLGYADGPGFEGESGLGTWVESRFGLGRFEGRRVRIRFLATSVKAGGLYWDGYNNSFDGEEWF